MPKKLFFTKSAAVSLGLVGALLLFAHASSALGQVPTTNPKAIAINDHMSLADQFDVLEEACGHKGALTDYAQVRMQDAAKMKEDLKAYSAKCDVESDKNCRYIPSLKTAMHNQLTKCHADCARAALASKSECFWQNLHDTESKTPVFKNPSSFCKTLNAAKEKAHVLEFISNSGIDDCSDLAVSKTPGELCERMEADAGCARFMRNDDSFDCEDYQVAAKEWREAVLDQQKLQEDLKMLQANDVPKPAATDASLKNPAAKNLFCVVDSAEKAHDAVKTRDSVSIECLQNIEATCQETLRNVELKFVDSCKSQSGATIPSETCARFSAHPTDQKNMPTRPNKITPPAQSSPTVPGGSAPAPDVVTGAPGT